MAERTLLRDLVSLTRGASYKGALVGQPGPSLLGLGTIEREGGFRRENVKPYGGPTPERIRLGAGDLYVSLKDITHKAELLGAVAQVPSDLIEARLTQDTIRLDLIAEVDRSYLYWALREPGYRAYCKSKGTGTTNLDLSPQDFLNYAVRTPSLAEQRGIAEVLGALDDKIAANGVAHEAASRLAVALAQSDETVRLDEVADQVKGTVNPASFGAALVDHFSLPAFDGGSGSEVVAGATIKSNKTRVAGNTVLISKLNPRFPRIWNVIQTDDSRPALASTEFIPVTSKLIPSSVLWAALSAPGFASALESKVAGTSGSHQRVKPADLLATEIADPRSLSAGAITSIVSLGQMRDAFMAQTGKLVATRDALLPLLMSGKVKVKDAESVVGDVI